MHSVHGALEHGGLRRRFAWITLFLFLLHNPTPYTILEYVQKESELFALRVSVGLVSLVILIVLVRQTWTGLRLLSPLAVSSLGLALASLIWYLWDWVDLNETTRYLAQLAVFSLLLTFGQVVSYYVRQFSGQKPVLKKPP